MCDKYEFVCLMFFSSNSSIFLSNFKCSSQPIEAGCLFFDPKLRLFCHLKRNSFVCPPLRRHIITHSCHPFVDNAFFEYSSVVLVHFSFLSYLNFQFQDKNAICVSCQTPTIVEYTMHI